jgi:hypothetical protein
MDEVNFNVVQGDTFTIRVEYRDESNQPIDITGYSAIMIVRDKPGGKVVCAQVDSTSGIVIDGPNGGLDITILPEQTRKFTAPRARYQIQIISDQGVKTTVLSGYFAVSTTVIR